MFAPLLASKIWNVANVVSSGQLSSKEPAINKDLLVHTPVTWKHGYY